jgi:hypothetical protein
MSQIASSYIVSIEMLGTLGQFAGAGDFTSFWDALQADAVALPPYEYSGYIVAVFYAFADEFGVSLPLHAEHPAVNDLLDNGMDVLICANKDDAAPTLQALDGLNTDEAYLREYFENFTAEKWDEVGVAMRAALGYLRSGLEQIQDGDSWLLVFVG